MLWFTFFNAGTSRHVYLNLAHYSVAIGVNESYIYPALYHTEEYYTVSGNDAKRLMKIMDYQAERSIPAEMGELA